MEQAKNTPLIINLSSSHCRLQYVWSFNKTARCPAVWIKDSICIPPFVDDRDSQFKQHEIIPLHEGTEPGKDSMQLQISGILLVMAVAYATIEGE